MGELARATIVQRPCCACAQVRQLAGELAAAAGRVPGAEAALAEELQQLQAGLSLSFSLSLSFFPLPFGCRTGRNAQCGQRDFCASAQWSWRGQAIRFLHSTSLLSHLQELSHEQPQQPAAAAQTEEEPAAAATAAAAEPAAAEGGKGSKPPKPKKKERYHSKESRRQALLSKAAQAAAAGKGAAAVAAAAAAREAAAPGARLAAWLVGLIRGVLKVPPTKLPGGRMEWVVGACDRSGRMCLRLCLRACACVHVHVPALLSHCCATRGEHLLQDAFRPPGKQWHFLGHPCSPAPPCRSAPHLLSAHALSFAPPRPQAPRHSPASLRRCWITSPARPARCAVLMRIAQCSCAVLVCGACAQCSCAVLVRAVCARCLCAALVRGARAAHPWAVSKTSKAWASFASLAPALLG